MSSSSSSSPTKSPASSSYHHCYLLRSLTTPSKTYIGYTTNPSRRIKQHNGIIQGGAYQTSKCRPWKIICVIGGFSSEVDGLKFEWAWQHPNRSTIFRSGFERRDAITDATTDATTDTSNTGNTGSNKALINTLLKSYNRKGNLYKNLSILMILLCESTLYKHLELSVNFLDEENEEIFRDLFHDNSGGSSSSDDDDDDDDGGTPTGSSYEQDEKEFKNWCKKLPNQMTCRTIESLDVLPFAIALCHSKKKKIKKKKNNANNNTKSAQDAMSNTNGNYCTTSLCSQKNTTKKKMVIEERNSKRRCNGIENNKTAKLQQERYSDNQGEDNNKYDSSDNVGLVQREEDDLLLEIQNLSLMDDNDDGSNNNIQSTTTRKIQNRKSQYHEHSCKRKNDDCIIDISSDEGNDSQSDISSRRSISFHLQDDGNLNDDYLQLNSSSDDDDTDDKTIDLASLSENYDSLSDHDHFEEENDDDFDDDDDATHLTSRGNGDGMIIILDDDDDEDSDNERNRNISFSKANNDNVKTVHNGNGEKTILQSINVSQAEIGNLCLVDLTSPSSTYSINNQRRRSCSHEKSGHGSADEDDSESDHTIDLCSP